MKEYRVQPKKKKGNVHFQYLYKMNTEQILVYCLINILSYVQFRKIKHKSVMKVSNIISQYLFVTQFLFKNFIIKLQREVPK